MDNPAIWNSFDRVTHGLQAGGNPNNQALGSATPYTEVHPNGRIL